MADIETRYLISRSVDTFNCRTGRSDTHQFRLIQTKKPNKTVGHFLMPDDIPHLEAEKKLLQFMQVLDLGIHSATIYKIECSFSGESYKEKIEKQTTAITP